MDKINFEEKFIDGGKGPTQRIWSYPGRPRLEVGRGALLRQKLGAGKADAEDG